MVGLSFAHRDNLVEELPHWEEEYGAFREAAQYLRLEGDHSHQKRIGWDQIDQSRLLLPS